MNIFVVHICRCDCRQLADEHHLLPRRNWPATMTAYFTKSMRMMDAIVALHTHFYTHSHNQPTHTVKQNDMSVKRHTRRPTHTNTHTQTKHQQNTPHSSSSGNGGGHFPESRPGEERENRGADNRKPRPVAKKNIENHSTKTAKNNANLSGFFFCFCFFISRFVVFPRHPHCIYIRFLAFAVCARALSPDKCLEYYNNHTARACVP